jgi:hypothetical protein
MHTVLLVSLAPLTNLVLFGGAAWGAHWLGKKLPEGRVKRILFSRVPLSRKL